MHMDVSARMIVQRFLIPQRIVNLIYMLRYRCFISSKAEVELTKNLILGRGVTISSFTKFKATNGILEIGKESGFATCCFLSAESGGIKIGNYCIFGPNVTVTSSNYIHDRLDVPFKEQGFISKGVVIGNNVWVGAGSTILDGTVVGENTIVVANSLLNRRYPPNSILQGNPAKVILKRSQGAVNDEGKDFRVG
jgi:acetyltransferase-like isoleucine patch superfamily enzyme